MTGQIQLYSIVVTTAVFPLFYKSAAAESGVSAAQSTAYLGYTIAISTFILAMLGPILGTIADYERVQEKVLRFLCVSRCRQHRDARLYP
ncbi:efflux transporter [Bacillus subtilis]|nr:efflux transporter [Bacillus subtilis]